jgi:hypothetical protein
VFIHTGFWCRARARAVVDLTARTEATSPMMGIYFLVGACAMCAIILCCINPNPPDDDEFRIY